MKQSTKTLLRKLANGRPKPSRDTLKNLFLDVQNTRVDTLVDEFFIPPKTASKPPKTNSPLENYTKSALKGVGGKVKDFIPYLLQAAAREKPECRSKLKPSGSLKAKIDQIDAIFGDRSKAVVEQALKKFIAENDVSYRLARA